MKNKLSLPSRKILYVTTLAMLFVVAAGFYMLAPATATVVEAQKAGTTGLITSDLPPRPDQLAIALDFRSAHNLAVFGGKGIDDAGGTTFRGAVPTWKGANTSGLHGDALRSATDRGSALGDIERTRNIINQLPCTQIADGDLTGKAFGPGVYCLPSMRLAGQLTLDGIGDAKASFVFVVKGSLNAERGSSFNLQNGAAAQNIYFVADDKATVASGVVFGGTILARNDVTLEPRADLKGRALSVQGTVSVGSEAAAGGGTGILEICKDEEVRGQDETEGGSTPLSGRIFRFQIGGNIYQTPVGSCTGPIELAVGNVVITELIDGPLIGGGTWFNRFRLVDVNSPTPGALGAVNLTARTANVFIREGDINNMTIVRFVNTFAITAVIEICKRSVAPTVGAGSTIYGVQPATGRIVRVNPATGAVATVGNAPAGLTAAHTQIGLSGAENGTSLIYVNSNVNASQIFRLNPANAAILSTESQPGFTTDGLSAQTAGNTNFIYSSHDSVDIHRQVGFSGGASFFWSNITPQGGVGGDDLGREFAFTTAGDIREYDPFNDTNSINTIPAPAANIEGLAYDGNFLYASSATGAIYTLNPNTGAVLDTQTVAGGALFALGATNIPDVNDQQVEGFFDFTVDAIANTVFSVPVGQCTSGITVNVPTDPGPVPQDSIVRVTELAEPGFQLEDATTFPADRFISLTFNQGIRNTIACSTIGDNSPVPPACVFGNPGGGYVTGFVIEGGVSNQTTFNFFNRSRPGRVKICKVAGPGIPIGTIFRYRVRGLGPSNPFPGPIFPGLPSDQFVDVPAGPANQGGFCEFADGLFIIGSIVRVNELGWLTPIPGVPPADVRISRIRFMGFTQGFGQATLTALSPPPAGLAATLQFRAIREVSELEYTNFTFRPTLLKICKEAGPGVAVGTLFTFTVVIDDEGGLFAPPSSIAVPSVTVPAGFCAFAQGPYDPTATNPPVGTFRVGSTVYVTEAAAAGTVLTSITSPTGNTIIPCVPANARCGGMVLGAPNGFNEITFRNQAASVPPPPARPAPFDFDGDRRTDISVTRPGASSQWYQLVGQNYEFVQFALGQNGDIIVPADYDGDGKTQAGVFRPSTGDWWVMTDGDSIENAVNAGAAGDIPLPSDYTGDGKADFVLFRPSTSQWLRFENGSSATSHFFFGTTGDKPLVGDFDGDGRSDMAVFRPSTGTFWYAASSQGNAFKATQWGTAGDVPAVADFDGDGKTDYAIFRPSNGQWWILNSSNGSTTGMQWGTAGDRPLAGDFDGDGRADVAVYRPSNGTWYIIKSGSGYQGFVWGMGDDVASPSVYVP